MKPPNLQLQTKGQELLQVSYRKESVMHFENKNKTTPTA